MGSGSWRCGRSLTERARRIAPALGSSCPATSFARQLLPTPLGPTRADSLPSREKFRSLNSSRPFGNSKEMPRPMTMEDINNPAQVRASVEEEKRDFEQVVYRVMVSLDFRPETPRVADAGTNFSCLCSEVPWTRLVTPGPIACTE